MPRQNSDVHGFWLSWLYFCSEVVGNLLTKSIRIDTDRSSIYRHRYWNTNLRSMFSMLDQGSLYQQKMPKKKWCFCNSQFWNTILGPNVQHTKTNLHHPLQQPSSIHNHPNRNGPSWSTDWTSPFRISSSIIPRKLGQSSSNKQFQKPGSCACRFRIRRSQGSRFGGDFFTKKRQSHTKVTMESQHALLANRM